MIKAATWFGSSSIQDYAREEPIVVYSQRVIAPFKSVRMPSPVECVQKTSRSVTARWSAAFSRLQLTHRNKRTSRQKLPQHLYTIRTVQTVTVFLGPPLTLLFVYEVAQVRPYEFVYSYLIFCLWLLWFRLFLLIGFTYVVDLGAQKIGRKLRSICCVTLCSQCSLINYARLIVIF